MSMATYEPDRDWGDENDYERHRSRLSTGLCTQCRENEALPDDELCADCAEELEPPEAA